MADRGAGPEAEPSALAAAVIDEETRRAESRAPEAPVIADDDLPGVNTEAMSLREAVRQGGSRTLTIIGILGAIEVFDNAAFNVLAPDIQDAIGVSDTVLGAIGGATGVLFVLGAVPMSSLSDRLPRKNLVAVSMSLWSVILVLTGLAQNAFQMFLARMGAGLGPVDVVARQRPAPHRHVPDPGPRQGVRGPRRGVGDRLDDRTVLCRRGRRDRR